MNAYVIDGGIRHTHTQFGGRAVPAFTSIDDGYGPDGCNYHGTHVAGTLGGFTFGVAKAVTLYSVRVLDCNGSGTVSGVVAGVDWVTANRRLPAVANMSLGGSLSTVLNDAVQSSINSGVTYVISAGNSADDACSYSPANLTAALPWAPAPATMVRLRSPTTEAASICTRRVRNSLRFEWIRLRNANLQRNVDGVTACCRRSRALSTAAPNRFASGGRAGIDVGCDCRRTFRSWIGLTEPSPASQWNERR